MKNLVGRLAGAFVLAGATVAVVTPPVSWGDPINCDPGQYWDPTTNVCRELGHTAAG